MYHDENRPQYPIVPFDENQGQPKFQIKAYPSILIAHTTRKILDCRQAMAFVEEEAEWAKKILSATAEERRAIWTNIALRALSPDFAEAEDTLEKALAGKTMLGALLESRNEKYRPHMPMIFEQYWRAGQWIAVSRHKMEKARKAVSPEGLSAFVEETEQAFASELAPKYKNTLQAHDEAEKEMELWRKVRSNLFAIQRNLAHKPAAQQIILVSDPDDAAKMDLETGAARQQSLEEARQNSTPEQLFVRFRDTAFQYINIQSDTDLADPLLQKEATRDLVDLVQKIDTLPDGATTLNRKFERSALMARQMLLKKIFKAPSAQKPQQPQP